MDARFHPAVDAIQSGDITGLRNLIVADPSLATSRSSTSHPTLLQCLVLGGVKRGQVEMARLLIDAGAELSGPLRACGSCNNVAVAALLLDCGAPINGSGGWSPIEESLYWNSYDVIDLLVRRGASIHNMRIAAGLGRTDVIEAFFAADGSLLPEAGTVNWPWGDLAVIARSNFDADGKRMLTAKFASFTSDRQSVINNAFVYACGHGQIEAANLLLSKGAQVNVIADGFDYSGTGLHYAALNGQRSMVEFLMAHGADASVTDPKVGRTAAGWAEYAGYSAITKLLDQRG